MIARVAALCFIFLLSGMSAALGQPGMLMQKFRTYANHHLQEKLFIHTDRSVYLSGETVWLRIYYVHGVSHHPLNISKVAYLEITDRNDLVVLQEKLEISDKGSGGGTLSLPVSLSSGNYTLRAYTSWMKNFGTDMFFHQTITIVNPFEELQAKKEQAEARYDVQFFPEGGRLVSGLESVVGFRAVDQTGKGIDVEGEIVNDRNESVMKFKPHKFGLGRFTFTPLEGQKYHAVLTVPNGKKLSYQLPEVLAEGMVMHLAEAGDNIVVAIRTKSENSSRVPGISLLAHTRNKVIACESKPVKQNAVQFTIPLELFGDGISHLTVFDNMNMPVCERLYFKQPKQELTIEVSPEALSYTVRKKAVVHIDTSLPDKTGSSANMSVSVFKEDSINSGDPNIVHYLLLNSDLSGNIESPGYYFEEGTPTVREAADNLMLTHGWRRFRWEDVLKKDGENFVFPPEYNGHIIRGQVKNRFTGEPAEGILAYLSSSGKTGRPYLTRSRASGSVSFEVKNFYGRNQLFLQFEQGNDSLYVTDIHTPFAEKKSGYMIPDFDLPHHSRQQIAQRSIHWQVHRMFHRTEGIVRNISVDSSTFYGPPDNRYRLDDFTRFPTMEEVMREYVPSVMVRKKKDGFHLLNFDEVYRTFFEADPLILLDGVPVFDTDNIMDFDPRQIKSLEVVNRKFYLAGASFNGIVSYRTYSGDLSGFQHDSRTSVLNYDGLQLEREFFSPKYEVAAQRESTIPDTRNLLYWSASVQSDKNGKALVDFFTSDVTGRFRIVVQGISQDGKPGYSSTYIEVKDKLNY